MDRQQLERNLSRRRVAYMGFTVLLALVLLGVAYSLAIFGTLKDQAEGETLAADQALAEIGAQYIADHQKALLDRLEGMASRNALKRAVAEGNLEEVQSFLRTLASTLAEAESFFMADSAGHLRLFLPPLSQSGQTHVGLPTGPYRPGLDLKPWVSPSHMSLKPPHIPVFTLSAPILDEQGRPLAYIGLSQRADYWLNLFNHLSVRPGRTFLLFDQIGNLVASGLGGATHEPEGLTRLAQQMRQNQMRSGQTVASLARLPSSPSQAFICAAPVPGLGWVLVVSHEYSQAMASSRAMFKNIVFFLVALLGCLLLLGYLLLSRYRIQQRMLAQLDDEARRLEETVRQRTADLEQSTARYRNLVQDLPDMVYETDAQGRLTFVSDAAEAILGYAPQEMLGKSRRNYVLAEDQPKFDEEWARAERGERMGILAVRHLAKDCRVRWLSIHSRGIYDDQGRLVGRRGVARDVTQQVLAERRVHELSHKLINAQEEERKRVALDLHDEMGQLLSALKIGLQSLGQQQVEAADQAEVHRLVLLSQKIMDRIRALAYHLRPATLDNFGLVAALEDLCDSLAEAGLVEVERDIAEVDESGLSPEVKTALFRLVQESLTNVVKHARSAKALVSLAGQGNLLQVKVRDFGRGFNLEQTMADGPEDKHLGLIGMQERMRLVGGVLAIESGPSGTTLTATVPLRETQ